MAEEKRKQEEKSLTLSEEDLEANLLFPPELFPSLEWLYNLGVNEILIGHRNMDRTKWSTGLSVSEWLIIENLEDEKGAAKMEEIIMNQAQRAAEDPILREEVRVAWVYYYHPKIMPLRHRNENSEISFVISHEDISREYCVNISLFPFLIPNQDGNGQCDPIWHKGGIKISWKDMDFRKKRWQVMKWTGF